MHTTNAATRARAGEMLAAYDGRDLLAADALGELDTAALSGVAAPTLVLTGARDTPMRRAAARALVRLMPSAERIEIDDAGHLCNLDQPAAFNAALREFLARAA